MNNTVTRLMALADDYRDGSNPDRTTKCRQALQDELQKLFTPLSDEQIEEGVKAWFENDIVPGQYPFSRRMRAAINAAHGIGETK